MLVQARLIMATKPAEAPGQQGMDVSSSGNSQPNLYSYDASDWNVWPGAGIVVETVDFRLSD